MFNRLSLLRSPLGAVLVTLSAATLFFILSTTSAFAANTISTKNYLESGTADGNVDIVRWGMDENVVACTYESADWSIGTAGTINITAITALTCTTTDANLDITVTTTANITGGGTEPVISYANTGQLNSVYLTSGAMTAKSSITLTDGAKPQINTFTYKDAASVDGKIDRLTIAFSESVVAASVLRQVDLVFGNVGDFTGAVIGGGTTDATGGGTVSSVDLDLAVAATVKDTAEGSGNIAITTQSGFRLDDATGNSNTTLGAQAAIATFADGAAPVVGTWTYSDATGDGKVETITLGFTETVVGSTSELAHNNLSLSAVGDFTSLAFGSASTDLLTSNVTSLAITLGTASSVQDTAEGAGTLAVSTTGTFDFVDSSSNTYSTAGAQSGIGGAFVDGAKPVITTFTYQDADDDGKIDTVVAAFSESVVTASVLTPAGLAFSNVGDFTAAAFGTSTSDSITGTVSSATLTLETESTAKDTAEGSGNIAITSDTATDTFRLDDSTGNSNQTYGAQSVSAVFADGAAPQIATATYSDADGDAKIDTIALGYTETVTGASTLKRNDVILGSVGDFTALAFGTDTTDLITSSVTSTSISLLTLGTESSAVDTNDASGNFAITSQNTFSLTDGTNTNNELEAQMSSSAAAADGAAPMLVTTSPASAATGVARSATIVLTFSEPISTGSFAWTKTNGPATTQFTSAWTSSNAVNTLTVSGLQSPGAHTIQVTAAPDPSSNTFAGALAAIANPFTYTVIGGSTTASGASSSTTASYAIGVTSPNGGETLVPGSTHNITWTSSATNGSMSAVNLNLIYGSGSTTQTTIATNVTNGGVYAWTVPNIDTQYAKIQVVGTDLSTTLATDESDGYFTISGTSTSSSDSDTDVEDNTSNDVTVPSTGTTGVSPVTGAVEAISEVSAGMYVRSPFFNTVYYIDTNSSGDLIRRPFMDAQTFLTYQSDWDDVETVTDATLPTLSLGGPMLPMDGVVLVKIQTVPKVYAIEADGTLRWVTSESVAIANYGAAWANYVIDIPDTLFPRFGFGNDISSDENPNTGVMKTRMQVNR